MAIDKNSKAEKAIRVANFMRDAQGKLKSTNNWSGLRAAVRTIVDGGKVKTDFSSDEYLERGGDDANTN